MNARCVAAVALRSLFLAALCAAAPRLAHAEPPAPDPSLWDTDQTVDDMAISGSTLYLGGRFNYVGPRTGGFVAIDSASAAVSSQWPRVLGHVFVIAPDGAGGWFIAGNFVRVAGLPRRDLAHIRADRSVDPWAPLVPGWVRAVAVQRGVLYVFGEFTPIDGQGGSYAAAFDAVSLARLPWSPAIDGDVEAATLGDGVAYIAGAFTSVGGEPRSGLAAVDLATGAVTPWNPAPDTRTVHALAVSDGIVYAGGRFSSVGGQPRPNLAAIDAGSGIAAAWNPGTNGDVAALVVGDGAVFVGGSFTQCGGQARASLAALDASSGDVLPWQPSIGPDLLHLPPAIRTLAITGRTVYLGGDFASVNGEIRVNVAAVDAQSGALSAWAPYVDGEVDAMAVAQGTVFAGGWVFSAGGVVRRSLAAIDLTTGRATDWNPDAESASNGFASVSSLATRRGKIYAGGEFDQVGGQPRQGFAVIDSASGQPLPVRLDALVFKSVLVGDTLIVGGPFTSIGGVTRSILAEIDTRTDRVTDWDARARYVPTGLYPYPTLYAIAVSGRRVFVSVKADSLGGLSANVPLGVRVLDLATANAEPWTLDSAASGEADGLAIHDGRVYAAGWIHIPPGGGAYNQVAAAFDAATGSLEPWVVTGMVYASPSSSPVRFEFSGDTVIVAGPFDAIEGRPLGPPAEFDAQTAQATAWNPLSWSGNQQYLGGLTRVGDDLLIGGSYEVDEPYAVGGAMLERRSLDRVPLHLDLAPPTCRVLSPDGGEALEIGATHAITWTASDDRAVESVDLYLSRSGPDGPWTPIALGLVNSGSYAWTVPGPEASGTAYVRVDARDLDGNLGSRTSEQPFTIAAGPTPTLVGRFDLEDTAEGVAIHWSVASPADFLALGPERGATAAGEWSMVAGTPTNEGGVSALMDRDAPSSGTIWYRLAGRLADGRATSFPAISISRDAGPTAFALADPAPNPIGGRATLSFSVPRRAAVRLSLVDVQGREVAVLADGIEERGRHVAQLATSGLHPGLYFLRMRSPGVDLRRRLVVVR